MGKRRIKTISKEELYLRTKHGPINFLLGRSARRRTIAIYVDDKAMVTVYCPSFVNEKEIFSFIEFKSKWIVEKIKEAKENENYLKNKSFDDGAEVLFLGKKRRLVINEKDVNTVKINFNGTNLVLNIPKKLLNHQRQKDIKKKLIEWYKGQAREVLGGRIFHYSRIIGIEPKKISIRTQKRSWGNCHYNSQTINLNWQIILSPIDVIDYIVVHELCHLKVPNHSQRFWRMVEKVIPDCRKQKKWLKDNFLDMVLL